MKSYFFILVCLMVGDHFLWSQQSPVKETLFGNQLVIQLKPDVSEYLENGGIKPERISATNSVVEDLLIHNTYQVSFDVRGGHMDESLIRMVPHHGKVEEPRQPIRSGYTFLGWYTAGAGGVFYDFRSMVVSNLTLYAKWIQLEALKNKLKESNLQNIGSTSVQGTVFPTRTDPYNVLDVLNTYLRTPLTDDEFSYIMDRPDLFIWKVTYGDRRSAWINRVLSQDFRTSESVLKESGELLDEVLLIAPYHHRLWVDDYSLKLTEDHNGNINTYGCLRGLSVRLNDLTVSFQTNGGTAVAPRSVSYGSSIGSTPTTAKVGHTLTGWYIAGTNTNYNFSSAVTNNLSLEARWEIAYYRVSFQTNGGTEVATRSVSYGSSMTDFPRSTRGNYIFEGWYIDAGFTTRYINQAITSNTVLYAKWRISTSSSFSNGHRSSSYPAKQ